MYHMVFKLNLFVLLVFSDVVDNRLLCLMVGLATHMFCYRMHFAFASSLFLYDALENSYVPN